MAVCGGLTNSCEKKRSEKQKRKGKIYTHLNTKFQRIAMRDKKAFLSDQCKEICMVVRMQTLEADCVFCILISLVAGSKDLI